jgi:hypothetical protein
MAYYAPCSGAAERQHGLGHGTRGRPQGPTANGTHMAVAAKILDLQSQASSSLMRTRVVHSGFVLL